jgi:hypothetical protein
MVPASSLASYVMIRCWLGSILAAGVFSKVRVS